MASRILNLLGMTLLAVLASSITGEAGIGAAASHIPNDALLGRSHHSHSLLAREYMAKRQNVIRRQCKARPGQQPPPPPPGPSPSPPPTTPRPPSNGLSKLGVAWANPDDSKLSGFLHGTNAGWYYTWSPYLPPEDAPAEGFVMLWGADKVEEFYHHMARYTTPSTIMAMNEPDHHGQSNMSPRQAAELFVNHITPYMASGWANIGPACTNAPAGILWYREFMEHCRNLGCGVQATAFHYYGLDPQALIALANQYHDEFGLNVYVTEYACHNFDYNNPRQCTREEVFEFARVIMEWARETDWMQGFAPFGALTDMVGVNELNRLMTPDYQITDLGYYYASYN